MRLRPDLHDTLTSARANPRGGHGRRVARAVVSAAVLAVVGGCSLPLKVVRIDDPSQPVRGIRYVLKRPSYKVLLRLDPSRSLVASLPASECLTSVTPTVELRSIEAKEYSDLGTLARSSTDPAVLEDRCFCVAQALQVVVRQEMNGPPLIYEVRSHTGPAALPHALANTSFTVTMLDDGSLSAVSAGEDDQTLEFVQAVAGIALEAAKSLRVARATRGPLSCALFSDPAFHDYVRDHVAMERRGLEIARLERHLLAATKASASDGVKDALESLALLRTEREALATASKGLGTVIPEKRAILTVDGVRLPSPPSTTSVEPWFKVEIGQKPSGGGK